MIPNYYLEPYPNPSADVNLKPCPECGAEYNIARQRLGPATIKLTDRQYRVMCLNCWHKAKAGASEDTARRNWNEGVRKSHLRELRTAAGLSQERLQEATGVGYNSISRIENGHMVATDEQKQIFSDYFGVAKEMI